MFSSSYQQKRSVVLVPCIESQGYIQVFVELVELSTDDVALQTVLQELLAFCEVISRTSLIHELRITPFSLGTAVARGLTHQSVVGSLKKVVRSISVLPTSRTTAITASVHRENNNNNNDDQQLDEEQKQQQKIERFIRRCMNSFTRARLVIKNNHHHHQHGNNTNNKSKIVVECEDEDSYTTLYNDPLIKSMTKKIKEGDKNNNNKNQQQHAASTTSSSMMMMGNNSNNPNDDMILGHQEVNSSDIDDDDDEYSFSFELEDIQCANHVVARSFALGMPLRRQYDFESDMELRKLNVALRSSAQPRPYQKAAIESAIVTKHVSSSSNNSPSSTQQQADKNNNNNDDDHDNNEASMMTRSRRQQQQQQERYSNSGVIVIPCGGGKTLVGVMCFTAIRRPTVILCVNAISVDQWKEQIEKYAHCTTGAANVQQQQQHACSSSANYQKYNRHQQQQSSSSSGYQQQHHNQQIKISLWTAKKKDPITRDTDVVITTYHALAGLVRRRDLQRIANNRANAANNNNNAKKSDKNGSKKPKNSAASKSSTNNNAIDVDADLDDNEQQQEEDPIQKQFNEEIMRRQSGKKFVTANNNNNIYLKNPLLDWSWGLLILDEAHVVPAPYFRDGVSSISAKCTIGLTATFVREDDKIGDLQHLCGPKLFDIGWETLRDSGYLASVKCREVIVPLPQAFQSEYWNRLRGKFDFRDTATTGSGEDSDEDSDDSSSSSSEEMMMSRKKKTTSNNKSKNKKKPAPKGKKAKASGKRRGRNDEDDDDNFLVSSGDDQDDAYYSSDDEDVVVNNNKKQPPKQKGGNQKKSNRNDVDADANDDLTPMSNKNLHPVLIALAASNPNKILCAKRICERHRGQKILIFCDIITLLLEYSTQLKCPAIHGGTPHAERVRLFSDFENTSTRNVLCVSRVGEIAINLPSARVVIQVSSHGGSRRQEVQRLGRVLRPKNDHQSGDPGSSTNSKNKQYAAQNNASWFYSLVSSDTIEVDYAARRSRFLIDQGYQTDQERFDEAPVVFSSSTTTNGNNDQEVDDKRKVKMENNNNANNNNNENQFLNRDWILAWLVKVIARWELDFAPDLMRLQNSHQSKKKGSKNNNKNNEPRLQQGETRQQRSALSKWTVGAEGDRVVYDEA